MPRRRLRFFPGRCHCGAVTFRFSTRKTIPSLPLRACQCGFCRKHGARTTSDADGRLELRLTSRDAARRYRFALRTADYFVCRRCGVYIAAVLAAKGRRYAVVNVNALDDPRPFLARAATKVSYDHEGPGDRVARRVRVWTPARIIPGP